MSLFKKKPTTPQVRHVVDGVIYDTNNATFLAMHSAQHIATRPAAMVLDFNEYLFKSHHGSFFLVMVPLTWAQPSREQRDDATVLALTGEAAIEWLTTHQEVRLIETHFPSHLRHG